MDGLNNTLLPLTACSVPKEVSAEATEVPVVTVNPFTTCAIVHGHMEAAHGHILFSIVFILDFILGRCWGPGCCGYRDQGGCAAAWDLADSIAGLSQDLLIPDPAPNCGKGWAEPEHSCRERNCCIFLPRGHPCKTCVSVAPPKCARQQPLLLLDLCPTVNALTMGSSGGPHLSFPR